MKYSKCGSTWLDYINFCFHQLFLKVRIIVKVCILMKRHFFCFEEIIDENYDN